MYLTFDSLSLIPIKKGSVFFKKEQIDGKTKNKKKQDKREKGR